MSTHARDERGRYIFEVVKFRSKDPADHRNNVVDREKVFYIEADDYSTALSSMREQHQRLLEDPEWQGGTVEVYTSVWKKITPIV